MPEPPLFVHLCQKLMDAGIRTIAKGYEKFANTDYGNLTPVLHHPNFTQLKLPCLLSAIG